VFQIVTKKRETDISAACSVACTEFKTTPPPSQHLSHSSVASVPFARPPSSPEPAQTPTSNWSLHTSRPFCPCSASTIPCADGCTLQGDAPGHQPSTFPLPRTKTKTKTPHPVVILPSIDHAVKEKRLSVKSRSILKMKYAQPLITSDRQGRVLFDSLERVL